MRGTFWNEKAVLCFQKLKEVPYGWRGYLYHHRRNLRFHSSFLVVL